LLGRADGAIHTASPGDVTSANLNATVVDAVTSAFAGTGKTYLQISGLWIYGTNSFITEESAFNAPPMVPHQRHRQDPARHTRGPRGHDRYSSA
jgi:hypothetical protein